jgi:hypothetical protein
LIRTHTLSLLVLCASTAVLLLLYRLVLQLLLIQKSTCAMHAKKWNLTLGLLLQHALLTVAAVIGSTATGTAAVHAVESPFKDCCWPGFDAALSRLSKALTFYTISSSTARNHAVHEEEFKALW